MDITKLPKNLQDEIASLKHGPYSIETEIQDALEQSETLEGFKVEVRNRMSKIISACNDAKLIFYGGE